MKKILLLLAVDHGVGSTPLIIKCEKGARFEIK